MPQISKLLILLGPSGVGKSTIINGLRALDERFDYISPYITRPLREGEHDKLSVSELEFDRLRNEGAFAVVNDLYGVSYGTPKGAIADSLRVGRYPVLDWPLARISVAEALVAGRLVKVYLEPPSVDELRRRLTSRGDNPLVIARRLQSVEAELASARFLRSQSYFDGWFSSDTGHAAALAQQIYDLFLGALIGTENLNAE